MQSTMNLLEKALTNQPAPYWTQRLKLARTTLATAKVRGHLSPAIAGALAEELGEDSQKWMVIAALESERDSACKTRMVRKILGRTALASLTGLAVFATLSVAPSQAMAGDSGGSVYYVK
jgi:hypothetical protein